MNQPERNVALQRLQVFIGEWRMELGFRWQGSTWVRDFDLTYSRV